MLVDTLHSEKHHQIAFAQEDSNSHGMFIPICTPWLCSRGGILYGVLGNNGQHQGLTSLTVGHPVIEPFRVEVGGGRKEVYSDKWGRYASRADMGAGVRFPQESSPQ